jgi:hypothetical protein
MYRHIEDHHFLIPRVVGAQQVMIQPLLSLPEGMMTNWQKKIQKTLPLFQDQ